MFTGIYLYWTKVPEISSRVPLSLAFSETNSFHHLAAGNIKKGVSIFGITGSYYETKRYIIQNGQNTGLCTLTPNGTWSKYYLSGVNGTTVSYNGATWLLYNQSIMTWVDNDSGYKSDVLYYYTISGAKNIVPISWTWTSKARQSATFGFQIGADVWTWVYDGWNLTHNWGTATVYMTYSLGNHAYDIYFLYYNKDTYMTLSSNKYVWSIPSTSSMLSGARTAGGLGVTTSDVMVISFGVAGAFSNDNNKGFGHVTWVKNLWFDTTKSMTR